MKNLKIGVKIFLSFGLVILMMFAITATVLITNLQTIKNINDAEAGTNLQSLVSALQTQFMKAQIQFEALSIAYSEEAYTEYDTYINGALALYGDIYSCIDSNGSLEWLRSDLTNLENEITAWDQSVQTIKEVNILCANTHAKALKAELVLDSCVEYLMKYLRNDIILEMYLNDLERMEKISGWVEYAFDMENITRLVYNICLDARQAMLTYDGTGARKAAKDIQGSMNDVQGLEVISSKTNVVVQEFIKQLQSYQDSLISFAADAEKLKTALDDTRTSGANAFDGMDIVLGSVDKAVSAQMDDTTGLANISLIIVLAVAVAAFIVAAVMAAILNSGISKPIRILSNALLQIGSKGDLEFKDELMEKIKATAEGKDEVAQAMGHLAHMDDRLKIVGSDLDRVAGGDLTVELTLLSEADTMGLALKKMVDSLNEMFREIDSSTAHVAVEAKRIAAGAHALAQGSTQQASAIEQLSSSISEISEETKDNAVQAAKAASLSTAVRSSAERGAEQMQEMMRAVKEINDASGNISKVIKVIDDIAFQTNILALNAAVEAARAGQHGKGFAVVAEEVRNLAAKSAEAAGNTGALISNSMEKARLGARIAEDTSASLIEIVSGINETSEIVTSIAKSSEQQSRAIEQINNGIDQVTKVVQSNSSTAAREASTSERLSEQSVLLSGLMRQFRLSEQPGTPMLGDGDEH